MLQLQARDAARRGFLLKGAANGYGPNPRYEPFSHVQAPSPWEEHLDARDAVVAPEEIGYDGRSQDCSDIVARARAVRKDWDARRRAVQVLKLRSPLLIVRDAEYPHDYIRSENPSVQSLRDIVKAAARDASATPRDGDAVWTVTLRATLEKLEHDLRQDTQNSMGQTFPSTELRELKRLTHDIIRELEHPLTVHGMAGVTRAQQIDRARTPAELFGILRPFVVPLELLAPQREEQLRQSSERSSTPAAEPERGKEAPAGVPTPAPLATALPQRAYGGQALSGTAASSAAGTSRPGSRPRGLPSGSGAQTLPGSTASSGKRWVQHRQSRRK